MKKILLQIALLLLLSNNCFAQSGWFDQNSGTNNYLRDVYFTDINTGWIVGYDGEILKTTNSGLNWSMQTVGVSHLLKIFFIDNNTGWIVGGRIYPSFGADKIVLKTTNAGLNWITLLYGSGSPFLGIYFINSMTGWLANNIRELYKTTNGGSNFIYLNSNITSGAIYFSNENTGVAGVDPYIKKTTNGGLNWTNVYQDSTSNISCMFFVNSSLGYAAGYGTILKTSDSGDNWAPLIDWDSRFRTSISFTNPNLGTIIKHTYVTSYTSYIDRTTNGGVSWSLQYSTNYLLRAVYFVNDSTGWVCGENGIILKTTTGGNPIGISLISSEIPSDFSLSQNYPNPFNPETKIKFDIPRVVKGQTSNVKLVIYDLLGREAATLVNEELKPGTYEADWDASNYSSGVYFYKLFANEFSETKKMVLIK